MKVLIADDSIIARNSILKMIDNLNFDLHIAKDGQEAIDKILDISPDLILLDLLMPKHKGTDILKMMKLREIKIPVIVLSADIQSSTKSLCYDLGATAFLNKPPIKEELIQTIEKILNQESV